jgi:hypothetical protein
VLPGELQGAGMLLGGTLFQLIVWSVCRVLACCALMHVSTAVRWDPISCRTAKNNCCMHDGVLVAV